MASSGNIHSRPGPAAPAAALESNSLVLEKLADYLSAERKNTVLDLGPALSGNIAFFGDYPCKLYIEDLYRTVTAEMLEWWDDANWIQTRIHDLLPYERDGLRFDVILTWDLFNYLGSDALVALAAHLTKLSRPGSVIFSLIYTLPTMPALPNRFEIIDEQHIRYISGTSETRRSPRYTQTQLRRLLPDFRSKHSFLLRNGTQEYLFVRE